MPGNALKGTPCNAHYADRANHANNRTPALDGAGPARGNRVHDPARYRDCQYRPARDQDGSPLLRGQSAVDPERLSPGLWRLLAAGWTRRGPVWAAALLPARPKPIHGQLPAGRSRADGW